MQSKSPAELILQNFNCCVNSNGLIVIRSDKVQSELNFRNLAEKFKELDIIRKEDKEGWLVAISTH